MLLLRRGIKRSRLYRLLLGLVLARRAARSIIVPAPDLEVVSLRGNVETRVNSALEGRLDAVVLAWAGLHRLGLEHHVTQRLGPPEFLPAVGQGALGLECRRDDAVLEALVKPLNHQPTYRAVLAERAVLAALEGGCTLPMAAWARDLTDGEAEQTGPKLALDAAVFDANGRECIVVSLYGSHHDPEGLGKQVAKSLFERGAERLLARVDSRA